MRKHSFSSFIGLLILIQHTSVLNAAKQDADSAALPYLDSSAVDYRTPLAGEGFSTSVFGEAITVPKRDLRFTNAWKLGAQIETPQPDDRLALPAGALYFWRHPDDRHLLRAEVAGVYNNIFWGVKPDDWGDLEMGLTFNNFTIPSTWNEVYDGVKRDSENIYWGHVRPGIMLGYRKALEGGQQDNMWQFSYILEPGYFYSARDNVTAQNMVLPNNTFELRNRLLFRYDDMQRNILSLPHSGFALGADLVYGFRANWADWGTPGNMFRGRDGQHYVNMGAYAVAAGELPFVQSDRHRFVTWIHAGIGHNLDRFSATRIGGGPNAMGMEYSASSMPVLPGTSIWEFYPEQYAIASMEYRYEMTWFSYLSAHSGLGYLNPKRPSAGGGLQSSNELLPWLGGRVSSGFIGDTMLMLDYAYSFNLVNRDQRGSNEIMLWLSGEF